MSAAGSLVRRARWRRPELVFWLIAFAAIAMPAGKHLILNEIAILALFALSLDLILGYAGVISLGHAAFFGFGAYAAGLICKHLTPDPVIGLAAAMVLSSLLGLLTSLLVLYGRTAYGYSLAVLFVLFLLARRIVKSPFGLSLMAVRRNSLRASALGVPVNRRLIAVYALAAAYAGAAGALLAQTTAYVSLEVLEFNRSADVLLTLIIGGTGWLYGGIAGAIVFKVLQDLLSSSAPQFWLFWMGLFLVVLALVGRERLVGGIRGLLDKVRP